ncbi:unnamed protein product, partial [Brenthis ino]
MTGVQTFGSNSFKSNECPLRDSNPRPLAQQVGSLQTEPNLSSSEIRKYSIEARAELVGLCPTTCFARGDQAARSRRVKLVQCRSETD